MVAGSHSITTLFSSVCTATLLLSSIASARDEALTFEQAAHQPQGQESERSKLQIECVAPGKAEATNLTMNDAKVRYALRRGETSFIIHLAEDDQRRCFTLENENMAAEGRLLIAISNERLAANNPNWSAVAGTIPFRHKRLFDLSLIGVEAEFVKLTFQVEDTGEIRPRDEPEVAANRFTVQP
jgi:hypothetical protein